MANDVVLFLLSYQTFIKPVKKSTITKHFKRLGSVKVFNEVMIKVREKLDKVPVNRQYFFNYIFVKNKFIFLRICFLYRTYFEFLFT